METASNENENLLTWVVVDEADDDDDDDHGDDNDDDSDGLGGPILFLPPSFSPD